MEIQPNNVLYTGSVVIITPPDTIEFPDNPTCKTNTAVISGLSCTKKNTSLEITIAL
jgi:hypothetical protein